VGEVDMSLVAEKEVHPEVSPAEPPAKPKQSPVEAMPKPEEPIKAPSVSKPSVGPITPPVESPAAPQKPSHALTTPSAPEPHKLPEVSGHGLVQCDCGGDAECSKETASAADLMAEFQRLLSQLQGMKAMPKLNLAMACEESDEDEEIMVEVKIRVRGKKHNHSEEKCGELRGLLGAQGNCLLK
jgi:hypothetical protein